VILGGHRSVALGPIGWPSRILAFRAVNSRTLHANHVKRRIDGPLAQAKDRPKIGRDHRSSANLSGNELEKTTDPSQRAQAVP